MTEESPEDKCLLAAMVYIIRVTAAGRKAGDRFEMELERVLRESDCECCCSIPTQAVR